MVPWVAIVSAGAGAGAGAGAIDVVVVIGYGAVRYGLIVGLAVLGIVS